MTRERKHASPNVFVQSVQNRSSHLFDALSEVSCLIFGLRVVSPECELCDAQWDMNSLSMGGEGLVERSNQGENGKKASHALIRH